MNVLEMCVPDQEVARSSSTHIPLAGVYGYCTVQRRLGSQMPSYSSNIMEKEKIDKSPSSKGTTCKSMASGCAQSFL